METNIDLEEVKALMAELGMSTEDAADYQMLLQGNLEGAALIDAIPVPEVKPVSRTWSRPAAEENPLGAWYVRTHIKECDTGKLAGKTVAIKDNVLLAGVPLMNGTEVLEGYVPDVDAEIIRRLLDEGATITGKTVCEAYCFSGGSHTAATGHVRNPHRLTHSAGGSSSGSGALIAANEVDMAIGCDQGGSIRMPSSFCGIVGMKPTHSLVPYTGVLGMNPNIDHTGPMTRTVADNALMLEVLAGPDGEDSRQCSVSVHPYTESISRDIAGLRIGILREGFGTPLSELGVDQCVRAAAERFENLGASVSEISVPLHAQAGIITMGGIQMMVTSMFDLDGFLIERPDLVPEEFIRRQSGWRDHTDNMPPNLKMVILLSSWFKKKFGYELAARSMQRIRTLRNAYDDALKKVDALLLPTTPMKATPLPQADASIAEQVVATHGPVQNTAPFNNTHHPAISIPCGSDDGLPVGMMLVGRMFDEMTLYTLASSFEDGFDWRAH